jgi:hypothetical protein
MEKLFLISSESGLHSGAYGGIVDCLNEMPWLPKAATRSPVPGGGARRAGIPRLHTRGRCMVHLRTDN